MSIYIYEGCSKWIAYFYLETSNFKLAQKYSFLALEVLPVARNAKFQPMYPLLESVTVRWFGHSNKVLMNGRSKCLSGLVFPPSKECFQFRKQKEITWGKVWGIRGWGKTVTFSFFKNAVTIAEPASVAQLDACPTGDQEVAGSTPAEVGNILSWRLIMKYFLRSFSPFRWFKKGSCQFLAKECAQYWLTA